MNEADLRAVLLVKAIEEGDRAGVLLTAADRAAAAREAQRAGGEGAVLLVARARSLLAKLAPRHPFIDSVLALARGPAWVGYAVLAGGLAVGFALSALDGTRRINILAFPLLALVLWNFAVYVLVLAGGARSLGTSRPPRRWLPHFLARLAMERVANLVARSAAFHVQLAEALRRFSGAWFEAGKRLLIGRAARVFHLGAAAIGVGLIAGLYLRGVALDYQAGWESTFLDAHQARALLSVFYGPASWVTGIPIPDAARLEAIRFHGASGGASAAPWIHLLAATAALLIVLPRLGLVLLATIAIERRSRNMPLPASLTTYQRIAFGEAGGAIGRGIVVAIPYAYEPSAQTLARLKALLPSALGEHLAVDVRASAPFGAEDALVAGLAEHGGAIADVVVLLFSLATTPEEENHGVLLAGVRDWLASHRPQAQLLVLVDEGPYATRMGADGGAARRVDERRESWRAFAASHGLPLGAVNLAVPPPADGSEVERVRKATWQST